MAHNDDNMYWAQWEKLLESATPLRSSVRVPMEIMPFFIQKVPLDIAILNDYSKFCLDPFFFDDLGLKIISQ